jgi:hypothetical protein
VAAVLRQLVCDLCGDSGGAQQLCHLCGVSPYGAASGNRQRRLHREIVAAVLRQLVCDLCGDSGGAQQPCQLCGVSPYGAASGNRQRRLHREIVAMMLFLFLSTFYLYFPSKKFCCETLEHWRLNLIKFPLKYNVINVAGIGIPPNHQRKTFMSVTSVEQIIRFSMRENLMMKNQLLT